MSTPTHSITGVGSTTLDLSAGHKSAGAVFDRFGLLNRMIEGNEAIAPIFEAWMKPFHNLGMTTLTIRNTGGTDHGSFDAIGLPGWSSAFSWAF